MDPRLPSLRRGAGRAALLLLSVAGCAAPAPGPSVPERCVVRAWYRPQRALQREELGLTREQAYGPELIGSWDGFLRPGLRQLERRLGPDGTEWLTLALPLPPGRYRYGFLVGDSLLPDDQGAQSEFGPHPLFADSAPYEAEWTVVQVPDCREPVLLAERVEVDPASAPGARDGALAVGWRFQPGTTGADLDEGALTVELRRGPDGPLATELGGARLAVSAPEAGGQRSLRVEARGLEPGKYSVVLRARDREGRTPPPARASVLVEPPSPRAAHRGQPVEAPGRKDTLIYHLLIDRFRGRGGALAPPASPGRRAGGTLAGVRAAVEAGYFSRLGVTTLWLSPLYQNPTGVLRGRDGNLYEAYHGYWPVAPRSVEPILGGEAELVALVAAAHARGLRILFDAVPNHVHSDHPYFAMHSRKSPAVLASGDPGAASWFNDGPRACVCGSPGCDWGSRIEDCWFDSYLPDLNWRHPEVVRTGVDDLLWWMSRFDLDGMRIDAVPMMPRAAARRMVGAVEDTALRGGLDLLLVGETYTGPGDLGRAEIRSFLGQHFDGLHSAFDFPLMWALRAALASDRMGLDELEDEIAASARAFAGSGAVMANLLDNHDTPRFVSEAAGNAGNDPWTAPPEQPREPGPYRRQLLGLALLFTLPGLPVLYYGDEVGLAGANDPDARRVLPDVLGDSLPAPQAELLRQAGRLGRLRACLPVLRRGVRVPLYKDPERTVALHRDADPDAGGDTVLVVLSRASTDRRLTLRGARPGRYRDVLSGATLQLDGEAAELVARAEQAAVYVPEASPCADP